jgi:preprotein translocase subunit SecD
MSVPPEHERSRSFVLLTATLCGVVVLAVAGVAGLRYLVTHRSETFGGSSTTVTLEAAEVGGTVDASALDRVRQVLLARLRAAELPGVSVTIHGSRQLVVRVAGAHEQALRSIAGVGALSFRRVLQTAPQQTQASADPGAATGTGSKVTREQVAAKLGSAYQVAEAVRDPAQISAETLQLLQPFATLPPDEVAVLPAEMQYALPTISCNQLLTRPATGTNPDRFTACDTAAPSVKYLLDTARVVGGDVAGAKVHLDASGGWGLTVSFRSDAQAKWTNLTREVVANPGPTGQVAIVVDNRVVTAPAIQMVIPGDAEIAGGFSRDSSEALAAQLRTGPLPLPMRLVAVQVVRR